MRKNINITLKSDFACPKPAKTQMRYYDAY